MTRDVMLRGSRTAEPREIYLPPDRPEFFTDPRRACAPTGPGAEGINALFTSVEREDQNEAIRICRRKCPFVAECDAWATAQGETHFVWGGRIRSPKRLRTARAGVDRESVPAGTPDQELIERSLGSTAYFGRLTDEQKQVVVAALLEQGFAWPRMAQRLQTRVFELMTLTGDTGASLDDQVRRLYGEDHNDAQIAEQLRVSPRTVRNIRERLGLASKFGPGGKPLPAPTLPAARKAETAQLRKDVRDLHRQGLNDTEISNRLGRSISTAKYIRTSMGLSANFKPGRPRKSMAEPPVHTAEILDRAEAIRALHQRGLNDPAIADELGASTGSVAHIRRDILGLPSNAARGWPHKAVAVA